MVVVAAEAEAGVLVLTQDQTVAQDVGEERVPEVQHLLREHGAVVVVLLVLHPQGDPLLLPTWTVSHPRIHVPPWAYSHNQTLMILRHRLHLHRARAHELRHQHLRHHPHALWSRSIQLHYLQGHHYPLIRVH